MKYAMKKLAHLLGLGVDHLMKKRRQKGLLITCNKHIKV
jgi:hypothetical protein